MNPVSSLAWMRVISAGLVTVEEIMELAAKKGGLTPEELEASLADDAAFFEFSLAKMKASGE